MSSQDQIAAMQQNYQTTSSTVKQAANNQHFPQTFEPALIHPDNHAIVKLRENGMIDIFVEDDIGIRLDPATKTVNIIANGIKLHGGSYYAWVDSSLTDVLKNWVLKVGGNVDITVKGNTSITTVGTTMIQSTGDITLQTQGNLTATAQGDLNASAQGNLTVSAQGTGKIYSEGELTIQSGSHLVATAPRIDWNQ